MTQELTTALANRYLHEGTSNNWFDNAWLPVHNVIAASPAEALDMLDALISCARSTDDLRTIGCGPLEDFIGRGVTEEIEDSLLDRVRNDPRWALAVSHTRGNVAEWLKGVGLEIFGPNLQDDVESRFDSGMG